MAELVAPYVWGCAIVGALLGVCMVADGDFVRGCLELIVVGVFALGCQMVREGS